VKENKALEVHKKDIELLLQCIAEIPELHYVIQSPVIRSDEKIRLFEASFSGAFSPTTQVFIKLILEKRREEYLAGICRHFLSLLKMEQGIRSARVVTATPLDENLRKSIVGLIAKKFNATVELQEAVDESIIGGFILRVDDQQLDASISSKLNRIKSELINSHS
jgi:F-type H+-transporting ATPase subunit delta